MFIWVHISIQFCRKRIHNVTNMWSIQCVNRIHIRKWCCFYRFYRAQKVNLNLFRFSNTLQHYVTPITHSDYIWFTKNIFKNSYTPHEGFSFSFIFLHFFRKCRKTWLSRYKVHYEPMPQSINLINVCQERNLEIIENSLKIENKSKVAINNSA